MTKLNVVVFGAGRMGQFYIERLLQNPNVNLLFIVVGTLETVNRVQSTTKIPSTCKVITTDQEDLAYQHSELNAAIVCSPTWYHAGQVMKCLNGGMSVFCEKPISFSESEIIECYDLAEQKHLHLYCAFQRRHDASFLNAYNSVRLGHLGKLHFIKSCSRDNALPSWDYIKTSGGFFKDSTVHDIDMICWLAGELPKSVFACGHAHRQEFVDAQDYDSVSVTLKFPSGLIGIIDQDRYAAYGYDQRLEVFGEKGMIRVENPAVHNATTFDANGQKNGRISSDFLSRYTDAYETQLNNFFDLVLHNTGQTIKGSHVAAVDQIATAALLSSKTNETIEMNYVQE